MIIDNVNINYMNMNINIYVNVYMHIISEIKIELKGFFISILLILEVNTVPDT